jgi:FtsP/CotA-like multicopper oxidase with cupredoxin domain
MTISRRAMLQTGLAAGATALLVERAARAQPTPPTPPMKLTRGRAVPGAPYTPVVAPNGSTLPFAIKNGWKVFHLVAEPVAHQIAPGLDITAWGYNGSTPGPLIEAVEGDKVRIYVTNKLAEATSVHWHGVFLPNGMDGVSGLTQRAIAPGKTFKYEFPLTKPGTFMYHPHFDEMTQIALGMVGMIVVHPRRPRQVARVVRDYSLMAHEWKIEIGARRPDPLAMSDFNVLTFNSKSFPATEPLVAEVGDLVRIRLGNLGPMDHHPIHIHGHAFEVVETDGGPVPRSARWPETAILVPVGSVRVVEFVAGPAGDWPLHCHMTHHVMNQMGHHAPNLIGADVGDLDRKVGKTVPGYMTMGHTGMGDMHRMTLPDNSISMVGADGPFGTIEMGGMFTLIKVRDRLTGDSDPGWYAHPRGTVAEPASDADLARDGIKI